MSDGAIICIGGPLDGQSAADGPPPESYSRILWGHVERKPAGETFFIHDSLTADEVKQRIETLWGLV